MKVLIWQEMEFQIILLLFEEPYVGSVLGWDPNEYISKSVRRAEVLDFVNFNDFGDDKSVDI